MKFAYICTNYNNSHFTLDAVRTINSCAVRPEMIIVVDNASTEAECAVLRNIEPEHANLEIMFNDENVGYFAGLNVGIRRCRELRPDVNCMVIGNNDLEFPDSFGAALEKVLAEAGDRPVISPYIETLDGMPQNPHVISGISRPREFMYDLYYSNYHVAGLLKQLAKMSHRFIDRDDEQQSHVPQFIYQGHGSCFILTPMFFQEFEELWAPTFLMGEEYFLSRQLMDRGYMVYYDPRVRIRHRCNGAIEKVPARKMWGLARDAHRVYRRFVKPWHRQAYAHERKSCDT